MERHFTTLRATSLANLSQNHLIFFSFAAEAFTEFKATFLPSIFGISRRTSASRVLMTDIIFTSHSTKTLVEGLSGPTAQFIILITPVSVILVAWCMKRQAVAD